jgi:two-component system chemotaxis sensor kinase CheA
LDKAAIVEKAIAKGLIQNGERLTEAEIFNLILQPGFSTKKQITAVSGRGVGMDVVNRQMESIGGRIGIESQERKGMTITLTIPLTLAIIDGLLVRVGAEYFVVPLSVVTGCLEFRRESGSSGDGVIVYQESQLPFIDLREYFAVPGEEPNIGQIVVVMLKDARYGLLVDQIIGNSQAVIKPLDGIYRGARGISSATIRGDGSIALILDVEQMMRAIVKE